MRFLLSYPVTLILAMVALMSGFLSIFREVFLMYKPEARPRSLFWSCTLIAFVISALLLTYAQYQRAEDADKQLNTERDRSVPKLSGEIQANFTGISGDITGIGLVVTISNSPTGAPSIAKNYNLRVKLPSGREIIATTIFVPKTVTIATSAGPKLLYQEDALYTKTAVPILPGGEQTGFLLFQLQGMPPDELMQLGTTFTLEFLDINKKPYSCFMTRVKGQKQGFQYYPGMRPPG
jgi:hypothetical protein